MIYVGEAAPSGASLSFAIVDVERPGSVPTHLAGQLDADGVQLNVATVSAERVAPRRTVRSPLRLRRPSLDLTQDTANRI